MPHYVAITSQRVTVSLMLDRKAGELIGKLKLALTHAIDLLLCLRSDFMRPDDPRRAQVDDLLVEAEGLLEE